MARIKMAYIGGGSTRGAGTMASFIHQGENFEGSEVVLIDLDPERLDLIRRLAERMVKARGLDLTIEATTDRRAGLSDCDAILSSYRPGGFAARVLDERIPLKHGIIGQETQGAGGFFMSLRSVNVLKGVVADLNDVAPNAKIFNYTNPVNIVAQAVADHSDVPIVSLCEGPIIYAEEAAAAAGLDPALLDVACVGLNHGSWSVRHRYDGQDLTRVVARILREFRPTVVVMPHPYDVHLDHAHTSYFVTEALENAEADGALAKPRVLTYLVHHPSWPATLPPTFDRFVPIGSLPDTAWTETELSPAELAAKRAALAEYRSQLEVMQGFLRNFLCRNELFATVDRRVLDRIASLH